MCTKYDQGQCEDGKVERRRNDERLSTLGTVWHGMVGYGKVGKL
jgi:hypothetical protein